MFSTPDETGPPTEPLRRLAEGFQPAATSSDPWIAFYHMGYAAAESQRQRPEAAKSALWSRRVLPLAASAVLVAGTSFALGRASSDSASPRSLAKIAPAPAPTQQVTPLEHDPASPPVESSAANEPPLSQAQESDNAEMHQTNETKTVSHEFGGNLIKQRLLPDWLAWTPRDMQMDLAASSVNDVELRVYGARRTRKQSHLAADQNSPPSSLSSRDDLRWGDGWRKWPAG